MTSLEASQALEKEIEDYKAIQDPETKVVSHHFIIKHPWEEVVAAYQARFPRHPKFPELADTIETKKQIEEHLFEVERKVTINLAADFPSWMSRFTSSFTCLFIENSTVDHKNRVMKLKTQNDTWKEYVCIKEECVYEKHPDNENWTRKVLKPTGQVLMYLWGFEKKLDQMSEGIFLGKMKQAIAVEREMLRTKSYVSPSASSSAASTPSTEAASTTVTPLVE